MKSLRCCESIMTQFSGDFNIAGSMIGMEGIYESLMTQGFKIL